MVKPLAAPTEDLSLVPRTHIKLLNCNSNTRGSDTPCFLASVATHTSIHTRARARAHTHTQARTYARTLFVKKEYLKASGLRKLNLFSTMNVANVGQSLHPTNRILVVGVRSQDSEQPPFPTYGTLGRLLTF